MAHRAGVQNWKVRQSHSFSSRDASSLFFLCDLSRVTKFNVVLFLLLFISLFQGSRYHQYWGEHLTNNTTISGRLKWTEDKNSNLNTAHHILYDTRPVCYFILVILDNKKKSIWESFCTLLIKLIGGHFYGIYLTVLKETYYFKRIK